MKNQTFTSFSYSLITAFFLGVASLSHAQGTFNHGVNIGWIDWEPESPSFPEVGVIVSNGVISGYIYSANVGWIHLGSGSPDNGSSYSNTSGSDCGVNIDAAGNLAGYAYGANIGWINFGMDYPTEALATDFPRMLPNGTLHGFAYSANCGWITLNGTKITAPIVDPDSDGDGILVQRGGSKW
jgi:hypothetical protein